MARADRGVSSRASQVVIFAADGVLETRRYPQAQNFALVHVVASVFDGRTDMQSAGIATAKRFKRRPVAVGAAGSML